MQICIEIHTHTCSLYQGFNEFSMNSYVYVLNVSCMYSFSIHMCMYLYAYAYMLCVLYVLAQASTDAVTTGPTDLPMGVAPRKPHLGPPWAATRPLYLPLRTHPRTRFCAPARVARVAGAKSAPPAPPTGLPRALGARRTRLEPRPR